MTYSECTLETVRLPYDPSAQHARRKCIWHALSRRSRASIFAPSNVRGVSTSKEPWCNSIRRGVKSPPIMADRIVTDQLWDLSDFLSANQRPRAAT